jgi:hypothetical protein
MVDYDFVREFEGKFLSFREASLRVGVVFKHPLTRVVTKHKLRLVFPASLSLLRRFDPQLSPIHNNVSTTITSLIDGS